jgi:hypothetical protein
VIVADAAQSGTDGDYPLESEAFILVGTFIFWNQFIDWLAYHENHKSHDGSQSLSFSVGNHQWH